MHVYTSTLQHCLLYIIPKADSLILKAHVQSSPHPHICYPVTDLTIGMRAAYSTPIEEGHVHLTVCPNVQE